MLSLLKNLEFRRVLAPVVAGTSTQTTSSVDCAGVQTLLFVVGLGTMSSGATVTPTLTGSTDDSSFSALASSGVTVYDSEDNLLLLVEVVKPVQRYVKLQLARGVANTVIDLVIAICGVWHRNLPVTQDSTHVTHYGNSSQISPAVA